MTNITFNSWKKLFLFCFGLAVAASFCMKWMESDLVVHGEKFTILGLELFYSKEKLAGILSGLDEHVKTILRYHLSFDFAFMSGVYPAIASLCMMAREKLSKPLLKQIAFIAAALQFVAWAADIIENSCLFYWINNPVIGDGFSNYHTDVWAKWIIALCAALFAIPIVLFSRKKVVVS